MVRRTQTEQPAGEVIVVVESNEKHFPMSDFGITFDSSADEILEAVSPAILEEFGVNLKEEGEEGLYIVKKVSESGNLFIFPKSPAGTLNNQQNN